MRLPLFVAARPVVGMESPRILLDVGVWKLVLEGDASVTSIDGSSLEALEIKEETVISARVSNVGTEQSLSAYMDNGIN